LGIERLEVAMGRSDPGAPLKELQPEFLHLEQWTHLHSFGSEWHCRKAGPCAEIQIGDDLFIGPVTEEEREGSMIYSNHSCDPNIGVHGQIVLVAMRDIAAGEELNHDWAMTDNDSYEMECHCGTANCRKVITGQDWRKPELQEKYRGYMSFYLLAKIAADG
jgi:hypothetical protein